MPAYYRSTIGEFLSTPRSEVLAALTLNHANSFVETQSQATLTWWDDVESLQSALAQLCEQRRWALNWALLLEYSVPRKPNRLDVVLIAGEEIVVLECKAQPATAMAHRQLEHYALLLHYFHGESARKRIRPVLVSDRAISAELERRQSQRRRQSELGFETLPSFWIAPIQQCTWESLPTLLAEIEPCGIRQVDARTWDLAAYRPTPTIIEAACELRTGLHIREIAMSEAAEHDIAAVTEEIDRIIWLTEQRRQHAICFLTGVPGSGKTLVGLSLAHLGSKGESAIHFMSGNGPLVMVLQEVFRRQAMRDGVPATQAQIHARTLIENVHFFAKEYAENDLQRPPSNHVIIFDEAQRAWDQAQNLSKFKRDYSEPQMLLSIMERHGDWACVIALVGGGQEINSGEAGLEEWGRAISGSKRSWTVYASPEVLAGGASTAGRRLFEDASANVQVHTRDMLHLRTSNRSLRADNLAHWVNLVLTGELEKAADVGITERFPIALTRSLDSTRLRLREAAIGESRYGLVGSSKAARLRAEGLEPDSSFHGAYPWHHWYLAPATDVRSSFACEVFATEFEIQGLELDWIGLCWGGDFIWTGESWRARKWYQSDTPRWIAIKSERERVYRTNAYRVLLTRARQGTIIFVPRGDANDPSRSPEEMDCTADFLLRCGVRSLD